MLKGCCTGLVAGLPMLPSGRTACLQGVLLLGGSCRQPHPPLWGVTAPTSTLLCLCGRVAGQSMPWRSAAAGLVDWWKGGGGRGLSCTRVYHPRGAGCILAGCMAMCTATACTTTRDCTNSVSATDQHLPAACTLCQVGGGWEVATAMQGCADVRSWQPPPASVLAAAAATMAGRVCSC